jgi:hypothetical protein
MKSDTFFNELYKLDKDMLHAVMLSFMTKISKYFINHKIISRNYCLKLMINSLNKVKELKNIDSKPIIIKSKDKKMGMILFK